MQQVHFHAAGAAVQNAGCGAASKTSHIIRHVIRACGLIILWLSNQGGEYSGRAGFLECTANRNLYSQVRRFHVVYSVCTVNNWSHLTHLLVTTKHISVLYVKEKKNARNVKGLFPYYNIMVITRISR